MSCEQVVALAPELALDVSDGHERDATLQHLGRCPACRRVVSELSEIADGILLLAPEDDPPPGLESRLLAAMERADAPVLRSVSRQVPPREASRRPRWMAPLSVAAGFVLSVAIGAGAMFAATAGDRRVASDYRALLGVGHGSFFTAAPLVAGTQEVGTAWGYAGDPSWVFFSLRTPIGEAQSFRASVVTADGARVPLGLVELGGDWPSWGQNVPVDLATVRELRLEPVDGGAGLVATFHPRDPWGTGEAPS
jgi:hypothetical protein